MISVQCIVLITFFGLFVCGFAQYYRYPYHPYNYGNYRTLPVSTPNNYQQSPCRSSCNSYCQYLPCYSNYMSQPYYSPYFYNNRQYGGYGYPSYNFYTGSKKFSDPYANIPVEIIDDDSVYRQSTLTRNDNRNQQDEYANVPVEIIDDDNVGADFWRNIPILPKTTSYSNYSVVQGGVSSNSVTQSKPIRATITRSYQPQKKPEWRIDFLNGVPFQNNGNVHISNERKTEDTPDETTTVKSEEVITTTMSNDIPEKDNEEVPAIRGWLFK